MFPDEATWLVALSQKCSGTIENMCLSEICPTQPFQLKGNPEIGRDGGVYMHYFNLKPHMAKIIESFTIYKKSKFFLNLWKEQNELIAECQSQESFCQDLWEPVEAKFKKHCQVLSQGTLSIIDFESVIKTLQCSNEDDLVKALNIDMEMLKTEKKTMAKRQAEIRLYRNIKEHQKFINIINCFQKTYTLTGDFTAAQAFSHTVIFIKHMYFI